MEYLKKLLSKIKDKPACYLGEKSVKKLAILLGGYIMAVEDITHENFHFNRDFQEYIEKKFGLLMTTKHWSKILEEAYSDEVALDVFFECFEDFMNVTDHK